METKYDPKSTSRFSNRVENYVRYRPGYPDEVLDCLKQEIGLKPAWVVADIGSGTGILSEKFLKNGNRVFAVEPNDDMRAAAEGELQRHAGFVSIRATAESTTLPSDSIDLVVAGQAFHWFDVRRARVEFRRVLRSEGWVALLWNTRQISSTVFLTEYEEILQRFSNDYSQVDHRRVDANALAGFFPCFEKRMFANPQELDFDGLKGRLMSSSYAPMPGDPKFEPMMTSLSQIFDAHQVNGTIQLLQDTELYFGKLHDPV